VTFRFTVVGDTILRSGFAISFCALAVMTFCKELIYGKYARGRNLLARNGVAASPRDGVISDGRLHKGGRLVCIRS
jgi:hypothetical protein